MEHCSSCVGELLDVDKHVMTTESVMMTDCLRHDVFVDVCSA